ncbi:AraC family transcriptional regulator [Mycolicibacterium moriokaense]|nr:AraC family transcriptional regulator [Mycolicibacterium moriokaense]
MAELARLVRHRGGVPTYGYPTGLDVAPVSLVHGGREAVLQRGRHIHDFPALWYAPSAGLVYVAAAGEVLDPASMPDPDGGIGIFFDPAVLGESGTPLWPSWTRHPLLFPFLHGQPGGLLELRLPQGGQSMWDSAIASIRTELADRREGYQQAAVSHLTLLLIDVARLADDVVENFARAGQPMLAQVFAVIERRHAEPLSLRDVAAEIGVTPGHLTTVVRRRTGRTVQEWICERRMAEARTMLAETDLPVGEVSRRVGIADPAYFSRMFRRAHGTSPRAWRTPARQR